VSLISQLRSSVKGLSNAETSSLTTTPVAWRDRDGLWVGVNGEVWLYRTFTQMPLEWEDGMTRLAAATPLDQALHDLAATSKDIANGMAALARQREFHLVSIAWEQQADTPAGTPEDLRGFIEVCLDEAVPVRALLLGVKLRSSVKSVVDRKASGVSSTLKALTEAVTSAIGETVPDMSLYEDDRRLVEQILAKHGGKVPTTSERKQLEGWFNDGRGPDVEIFRARDYLVVDRDTTLEFSSVLNFEDQVLESPNSQWALDAFTHTQGTSIISIRGKLQPNKVARARVRQSMRRMNANAQEEAATNDITDPTTQRKFSEAHQVQHYITESGAPVVADCSIVFGRRVRPTDEYTQTFADELRERYGMVIRTLDWRQLDALDECMPCSSKRVGQPFAQDLFISVLSYAGLQGFTNLGDRTGVYIGLGDPDWTPVYLNPFGAPLANLPACCGILGDSGSGKTYLLQSIATQATLADLKVVMINPKPFDDLSPTVELVQRAGKNGNVVHLSRLEKMGGFFDPFRFASPELAAEIATGHILSVITGLDEADQIDLRFHMKTAATRELDPARCVMDALADAPERVRDLVSRLARSSALFALGVGMSPQPSLAAEQGFTLIQFDRKLDLPEESTSDQSSYTQSQRIALAAMRLITTASLEMLVGAGGVLIVDEAHHYLGSADGRKQLQSLGREGRSQGLLPILATQRISDLVGNDLESYISRYFVGKLTERVEAEAALRLCGLLPTEGRLAWLAQCGPKSEDGVIRPSMFLHKDLKSRHAAVMVGPVPPEAHLAFSTNPADRKAREEAKARDEAIAEVVPLAVPETPAEERQASIDPEDLDALFMVPGYGIDRASDPAPEATAPTTPSVAAGPSDAQELAWRPVAPIEPPFPAPAPTTPSGEQPDADGWLTVDDTESLDDLRRRFETDGGQ
jgi:hypothetical protein